MADDLLSQEEIDALLNQNDNGEQTVDSDDVSRYLTPFEQDAIGEIGNISFGSASTALSTLLNQKVDITTPRVSLLYTDRLKDEFPKPHVAVHVNYTQGFKGLNLLIIKMEDAAIIANLMLGGDGSSPDPELTELHQSAVQEAMNQMMGSAATAISTIFNKRVDISPPGIDIFDVSSADFSHPMLEEDVVLKVAFKMRVGELIDSEIMQLLPIQFAKEMVNLLMADDMREESQPVGADEPAVEATASVEHGRLPNEAEDLNPPNQGEPPRGRTRVEPGTVRPVEFSELGEAAPAGQPKNLELLMDIPLQVMVELGRTKRTIKEILELSPGSILELDKLAGEPVDILVNNKPIAKGEVVVIEENFGVRVTDILSKWDRLNNL